MVSNQLSNLFLEQSNDLIWIIDSSFNLKYANQAYQNVMKQVTGEERKLNENLLVEGFGVGYIEKWKAYYERGLNGEHFEIEEHFYNPNTHQVEYSEISFKPIADENGVIVNVACQSRDITSFIKSNAEAEILLDASSDVICSIDRQGNFTKVNAACKELWGYEKHELIGKPYIDFVVEEDVEKTNLVAADILDGKLITTFENRYKRKDGGIAFNLWSAKWEPKTQIMFGVARDGREKIKKEELMIESENRFRALVQEGSDMISIIDADGNYMYTTPTTTAILGITPEEFDGNSVFDFIHPDDIERAAGYMQRIVTEKKVIVEPFRLRDGNNEWRWIETVLTNMLDNPAVNGIVANSRDITENLNMLKDKEANELLYKTVIESSPDCLKIIGNEGRIIYMNFNGLCQMEIDDFSEFKNKQWWLLWGPENETLIRESVDNAFNGETVQFTAFCPTAKGTPKWWDVKVSPVIKEGETIEKIIAVSRDITVQKEEEQRLKLLESVITNTNDSVLITEAEPFDEPGPRILYVNEAFTRMTGYTAEEVIGKTPRILQGPNSDKAELARLSKAIRKWESCEITTINYKKNGDEFWVNFSVSPVVDQSGWCTHWIAIERDVTEIKQQEEKLIKAKELAEENELKMKEAQKLAHIGSWYYDFVNQVSQCSEETYNIWGLNPDVTSVHYVDHQKLIHPKDWERFNSVIKNAIEKGIPYKMDLELIRPDGSYKTVNTIGDPIFDETNKVIAFKGTTQDISERIIIENELRSVIKKAEESDARFKAYTQQSPIAIYTTDINGDCIYANETWLAMAGMQLEEALGKGWINALHPEDLEYVTDNWYKSVESNGEWNYEYRFVNSNKNITWVNGNAKKLFNDKNELIGYLGSNINITERKKAEQEKNSLLSTLEKSLNEIYVFDAETLKFSYVNQGALINLGYSEEEIKALTPLELKPEFTTTTFNKLVNPLVTKEKEKIIFFTNHKRKNGSLYPVEVHLQFVEEGNDKRFLAVILDITDLKETEQLLDSASKLARVGSWELVLQDNEEFKMFWSSMTKNIVEIDESFEPTLADGINLHKEPSRTLIAAAVNKAIETGEAFDLELELVTVKENNIWVRCIGDTQLENGKVTRIFGSYQDINTRKLAELNHLKLIEEKSSILESISDYFYAMDGEFNITYINSSAANLLAVNKEKIIGKNLFTEFPDLKNTLFEEELRKVQNTAEASKFEFYFAPFDAWFDESIYPTPTGISVYFVDITHRKKSEKELLALNNILKEKLTELEIAYEELEQFTFIASHDLQEPLRMINSFMDQLKRKYGEKLDDKAHQYIEFAIDGAKRMKQIILDLLEYSRAGKTQEEPQHVDINQILCEYKTLRRKVIAEKMVVFDTPDLPVLRTFKTPFIQVMHNLLDNAIKYAKDDVNPVIRITCTDRIKFFEFCIEDNGIGIDEKFFNKVFVIFQRLHDRDKYSGTGIGLSIVKKQIESLGGEIWINSKVNIGSKFYFTIPK